MYITILSSHSFMDLIMPELDGLAAAKQIREFDNSTYMVALTANATISDRDDCFSVGMNDFITKPVSLETLQKVISRAQENASRQ